jgi:hypothetical protein
VQYDPAHASLPWAGVRLVLQVRNLLMRTSSSPYATYHMCNLWLESADIALDCHQRESDIRSHARGAGVCLQSDNPLRHTRSYLPREILRFCSST